MSTQHSISQSLLLTVNALDKNSLLFGEHTGVLKKNYKTGGLTNNIPYLTITRLVLLLRFRCCWFICLLVLVLIVLIAQGI